MNRREPLVLLLLTAVAATASAGVTLTPGHTTPHAIRFTIQFNPLGMSVLRNQTAGAYWVLHDARLQSSQLEVRDAQGNLVPCFDERAIEKFDNTVRRSAFRKVEAGGELPLFELVARQHGELWQLRWGPFVCTALPAGNYTGLVVFESRVNQYFDEGSRTKRKLPNTWLGTVRSDTVGFRLPLH